MEAQFLELAFLEAGTKEIKGKNHNPRILQYHKFTSLGASTDEIAWCSSFANFVVMKAGGTGTNNAMARSWENWGLSIEKPVPGCLVIFSRGADPRYGHVAFFLGESKTHIYVLGGNQGDSVSIAKYPKSRLVCYRQSL